MLGTCPNDLLGAYFLRWYGAPPFISLLLEQKAKTEAASQPEKSPWSVFVWEERNPVPGANHPPGSHKSSKRGTDLESTHLQWIQMDQWIFRGL